MRSALRDLDNNQRTFMLTGEDSYLVSWRSAQANIKRANQNIRTLTMDNPRQQARLDRLDPLLEQRIDHSSGGVQARQEKGLEAAVQYAKSGEGTAMSSEILGIVQDMQSDEDALLRQRSATTDASITSTRNTILFGTLAGLLVAALAGILLSRNIARPLGSSPWPRIASPSATWACSCHRANAVMKSGCLLSPSRA